MAKHYPKRRRRAEKIERQPEDTQPLQPARLMEPATALQLARAVLEVMTRGMTDDYSSDAETLMRCVVTLWSIPSMLPAYQQAAATLAVNEAAKLVAEAVKGPVDYSHEADRLYELIDRLMEIKPGTG